MGHKAVGHLPQIVPRVMASPLVVLTPLQTHSLCSLHPSMQIKHRKVNPNGSVGSYSLLQTWRVERHEAHLVMKAKLCGLHRGHSHPMSLQEPIGDQPERGVKNMCFFQGVDGWTWIPLLLQQERGFNTFPVVPYTPSILIVTLRMKKRLSEEARTAVFKNHEVIHKRSNRRPGVLPINIYHILVCTGHQCWYSELIILPPDGLQQVRCSHNDPRPLKACGKLIQVDLVGPICPAPGTQATSQLLWTHANGE